MGRTADRQAFDVHGRLTLVEKDLDTHDEGFHEFATELAKIKGILIGILVSITTGCLLMVANLAVK